MALEARGIAAVILDENALGFIGLAGELRVAVADAAAAERVAAAIAEIPRPTTTPIVGKAWMWQRRGLKALAAGIVMLVVGAVVREEARTVGHVLSLVGTAFALGGFGFIGFGFVIERKEGGAA